MPDNNINAGVYGARSAGGTPTAKQKSSGGMSIDDFYKVLAAQLKYQDADNPMDTNEMMGQLVQTQMIDAINQMSQVNTITYASSMIGKTVTMMEVDENGRYTKEFKTGVITGVDLGATPILYMDGKPYLMSQIMSVGEVPDPDAKPDTGGDGDTDTGGTGGNDGDSGTV